MPEDLTPGWNQSDTIIRQLINMDWLYDACGPGGSAGLTPLMEQATTPDGKLLLRADLQLFDDRGWIKFNEAYEDTDLDAQLLPGGAEFVEMIRGRRADLVLRRREARDAVLSWAFGQVLAGVTVPNIGDFWSSRHSLFYAQQFTTAEIDQATIWLREKGYIKGENGFGTGVIRINITASGEAVAESNGSVNEAPTWSTAPVMPAINVNNSPGTVIQTGSPGATQNVTINQNFQQQALDFAELLRLRLPEANPDADVDGLARDVEAAANEADPSKMRVALTKVQMALLGSIGTAVGNDIWGALQPLLKHVGLG